MGKSSIISRYTQGSIDVMAVRKFAMYGKQTLHLTLSLQLAAGNTLLGGLASVVVTNCLHSHEYHLA